MVACCLVSFVCCFVLLCCLFLVGFWLVLIALLRLYFILCYDYS